MDTFSNNPNPPFSPRVELYVFTEVNNWRQNHETETPGRDSEAGMGGKNWQMFITERKNVVSACQRDTVEKNSPVQGIHYIYFKIKVTALARQDS